MHWPLKKVLDVVLEKARSQRCLGHDNNNRTKNSDMLRHHPNKDCIYPDEPPPPSIDKRRQRRRKEATSVETRVAVLPSSTYDVAWRLEMQKCIDATPTIVHVNVRSIDLSIYIYIIRYLSRYLSIFLCIYLSTYLSM